MSSSFSQNSTEIYDLKRCYLHLSDWHLAMLTERTYAQVQQLKVVVFSDRGILFSCLKIYHQKKVSSHGPTNFWYHRRQGHMYEHSSWLDGGNLFSSFDHLLLYFTLPDHSCYQAAAIDRRKLAKSILCLLNITSPRLLETQFKKCSFKAG